MAKESPNLDGIAVKIFGIIIVALNKRQEAVCTQECPFVSCFIEDVLSCLKCFFGRIFITIGQISDRQPDMIDSWLTLIRIDGFFDIINAVINIANTQISQTTPVSLKPQISK